MNIKRRTILAGGVSSVVGLGLSTTEAADWKQELDIIDCHNHFYDPNRPKGIPWPGKDSSIYRTVLPQHLREQTAFLPISQHQ